MPRPAFLGDSYTQVDGNLFCSALLSEHDLKIGPALASDVRAPLGHDCSLDRDMPPAIACTQNLHDYHMTWELCCSKQKLTPQCWQCERSSPQTLLKLLSWFCHVHTLVGLHARPMVSSKTGCTVGMHTRVTVIAWNRGHDQASAEVML